MGNTASNVQMRHGSNSGQPMTRRDGVAKVTGAATYAADNRPDGLLHAVFASAGIARGRVTGLDVAAAMAHPGVVDVITPDTRPGLAADPDEALSGLNWKIDVLQTDEVRYAGQPIALVVAETIEAATEGVRLLAPTYAEDPVKIGWADGVQEPPGAPVFSTGDVEAGLTAASQVTETVIETPLQYHNAMEPHAIVATWDGATLTVDTPSQAPVLTRGQFARYFGIAPEDVTVRSPYLGGGFGSKAAVIGPQILACLAAQKLGRPVKLALRREQMFGPVLHRAATRQTLKLGQDAEGRLTALDHNAVSSTSMFDHFGEGAEAASQHLYASPAIRSGHGTMRVDTGTPGPMRAPGEASGSAALECAVDEAAAAAGLDPLEFRLRNYAEVDPGSGKPFSSKALRECYALGAERFGWASRERAPRQMRDAQGRLVGWGVGTALFKSLLFSSAARAVLRRDGTAMVETSGADMGQGAWTALAQLGADGLGLDASAVELRMGRSDQPNAGVAGGSAHTASAGSALYAAGQDVVRQLAALATADPASPLFGAGNAGVVAEGGRLVRADDATRGESYAAILTRAGLDSLEGSGTSGRDASASDYAMYAHGAVFAEVTVDPDLYQMRVTRLIGAFAAGRIVNPRLVRSQLSGGMIWGLGFALHEEGVHDRRTGRVMNGDLAGYHVPVNADVPHIEALLVDEEDPHVNALGIKGVGELGITGTTGAIANAVWHATGTRVRRFPVHIADLLAGEA